MRFRQFLLLSVVVLCLSRSGSACLWTYATNLDGRVEEIDSVPPESFASGFIRRESREKWLEQARDFKRRAEEQPANHELRNDYAVMLARAGELTEALAVLNEIEATKPGLYPTAANLGTVYELSGDVDKALHWIQEGLSRNPKSHNGSEWLHVRILQTKQKMVEDPDWLKTHSILGLNFGDESRPVQPPETELVALSGPDSWEQLNYHLTIQLRERTSLVEAPDPIVADLLSDMSNLVALRGQLENAVAVAEMAQRYEAPRAELLERRLEHFRKIVRDSPKPLLGRHEMLNRSLKQWILGFALAGILLLLTIASWVRHRRRHRGVSAKPL